MAAPDAKLELLHSVSLFANLKSSELADLGQLSDRVDVPAGKVLMREGDPGREMFFVVSGAVSVQRDGREVARLGPGEVLGEMALISEGPRTATATATEPTTLFVLSHGAFHSLMATSPEVNRCVMDEMARRLRNLEPDRAH